MSNWQPAFKGDEPNPWTCEHLYRLEPDAFNGGPYLQDAKGRPFLFRRCVICGIAEKQPIMPEPEPQVVPI